MIVIKLQATLENFLLIKLRNEESITKKLVKNAVHL
jgi:hypothetical protein